MVKRFTYGGNRGNKEKMKIIGGESGKENGEVVTEVVSIFFFILSEKQVYTYKSFQHICD